MTFQSRKFRIGLPGMLAFAAIVLTAGTVWAGTWDPNKPWWCGQMNPNVCQLYTDESHGTSTYRHECLLNEGWRSWDDVNTFCLD